MSSVDGIKKKPIQLAQLVDESKFAPPPGSDSKDEKAKKTVAEQPVAGALIMSDPAVDTFNRWMLGPEVSDLMQRTSDDFVKWAQKDNSGLVEKDRDWYVYYPLAIAYVPTTIVSRLIPDFVSRLEYQPLGNTIMNIKNNGTENELVDKRSVGIELGRDLSGLGIFPPGHISNITFSYDQSDYTLGGGKVGNDTKLSFSYQSLDAEKKLLDGFLPPISGTNPLFEGKDWYKWPGDAIRSVWRAPSLLNKEARDWDFLGGVPGIISSIPLAALQFVLEDIPNSLLGGNIKYSPVYNTERNDPSFYDPSVKARDLGIDLYWSLGLFITTSYDQKEGTKEYTTGLEHNFKDYNWTVRIDAPNMLGPGYGVPFFGFYPWFSYNRGREFTEISPGSSVTTETDPITGKEITKEIAGHGGTESIEYLIMRGGLDAWLNIGEEKFKLGAEFSKETSEMQRDRSSTSAYLTYGPFTVRGQAIDNPIRYYDLNTRMREKQESVELEFNPEQYKGTFPQFLPITSIGHAVTKTEDGQVKDEKTYFMLKFLLGLPEDQAAKSAITDRSLKNLVQVEHMVGNNKYALLSHVSDLDSQNLRSKFESALSEAVNIITDVKKQGEFATKKRDEFNKDIEEFQKLVKAKTIQAKEATDKRSAIEGFIAKLSSDANMVMVEFISKDLQSRFNTALDAAKSVITDDKEKNKFRDENQVKFNDLLSAYGTLASDKGINSGDATTKKQEIEDLINGLQSQAQRIQDILVANASASKDEALKALIKGMLDKFNESYKNEMEKALAMIDTQDRKDDFKTPRDKKFEGLKAEFNKTATANINDLQGEEVTQKSKEIDNFIFGLKKEANNVMIDVTATMLKEKFNVALSLALLKLAGQSRKDTFKKANSGTFDKLIIDYKGIATNNLVTSRPAKDKVTEIENFIKGLANAAATAFAEVDKKAKEIQDGYKLRLDSAIKSAYEGIMGVISEPLNSRSVDISGMTLDEVKKNLKIEILGYNRNFDACLNKFTNIAEKEGVSSANAKEAEKGINAFMETLPESVKKPVNIKIAGMVKYQLSKKCDDLLNAVINEAENTQVQPNVVDQKKSAIDNFKNKNRARLDAKLGAYAKLANDDLCSGEAQNALSSLFTYLTDLDRDKTRLKLKLNAKTYFELIAYLYVDMVMERIALLKDGTVPKDKIEEFRKQYETKFSQLTGVDLNDKKLRDAFQKMAASTGNLQNIWNAIWGSKPQKIEFKPTTGASIFNTDEIVNSPSIREVWTKTEKLTGEMKNDAVKQYGGDKQGE